MPQAARRVRTDSSRLSKLHQASTHLSDRQSKLFVPVPLLVYGCPNEAFNALGEFNTLTGNHHNRADEAVQIFLMRFRSRKVLVIQHAKESANGFQIAPEIDDPPLSNTFSISNLWNFDKFFVLLGPSLQSDSHLPAIVADGLAKLALNVTNET